MEFPEPSAGLLLGSGVIWLCSFARFRRRSNRVVEGFSRIGNPGWRTLSYPAGLALGFERLAGLVIRA